MAVYLYLGAPQTGKSTLLRRHVYEHPYDVCAFLVVDRDGKKTWPGPVFTSAAQFRRHVSLPRWCVFRGVSGAEVAELALDIGDCVYVDEEVHKTIVERPWKPWRREDRTKGHPLYSLLHEGAHHPDVFGVSRAVSALIATHRPANLPTDLPALCDGVYLGRLPGFLDATRAYREGWVPQAAGPQEARRILAAKPVGDFSFIPLR